MVVPSWTTATGVSAARPWATSSAAIALILSTAISSTRVPVIPATAAQLVSERSPGPTCPEMTVNSWVRPRWVTGM